MLDSVDHMILCPLLYKVNQQKRAQPSGRRPKKVIVITTTHWGRIDTKDKKNFLMTSFKNL